MTEQSKTSQYAMKECAFPMRHDAETDYYVALRWRLANEAQEKRMRAALDTKLFGGAE
jgi:hypothetical protein